MILINLMNIGGRHGSALLAASNCRTAHPISHESGKRVKPMRVRQLLLGFMVAAGVAAAGALPALADWDNHGHDGGGWGGGDGGRWGGQPNEHWQDHGWWDDGHHWHWFAGWGPGYGYMGPAPVWGPPAPVYAAPPPAYYAPPPPPPVYYAPPPPPVYYAPPPPTFYVAPPPSIVISPGGIGIAP